MAVAMTTYGSTLSDLQRLTNEDRAIDNQRANFQDQINAQRLSDFLKARSEENKTKSQRDAEAAKMLDAQQARAQQGSQFDTQQRNLMSLEGNRLAADKELQGMAGANALEIAKLQSANRPMDPRYFDSLIGIQASNQEQQQKAKYAEQLSNARKATLAAKNSPMQASEDSLGWGNPAYKKRVADADTTLKQLDATALSLGLAVAPDGGYIIPAFTPIQVPAMLGQQPAAPMTSPVAPASVAPARIPLNEPLPFLSTDSPPARTNLPPVRRFRVTPDGQFMPQ